MEPGEREASSAAGLKLRDRLRGLLRNARIAPCRCEAEARDVMISPRRGVLSHRKRRCVVPMDSFFRKDGNGRRHVISGRDGGLFGVAGLWENWRNPSGDWERTFALVTVPA